MLRLRLFAVMFALVVSFQGLPFALAQTGEISGNINIFAGQKSLNNDDWSDEIVDISKQNEIGIKIDFKQKDWPVSIAIDYMYSKSDDSSSATIVDPVFGTVSVSEHAKGETSEMNLGVRKIFDLPSPIKPFIGGGLSIVNAKLDDKVSISGFGSASDSDTDNAAGFWIDGGVYATLAEHFNIGVELAYSQATVTLFDESMKAGGFHYGLLAGYHW